MWNDAYENTMTFQFRCSRVLGRTTDDQAEAEAVASEQVMAALVTSPQTGSALEWRSNMILLAVAVTFVAVMLFAVYKCTTAHKEIMYQPIGGDEAC